MVPTSFEVSAAARRDYPVRVTSTTLSGSADPSRRGASTVSHVKDPSVIDRRLMTVGEMFLERVRRSPDREAYRYPVGDRWESVTWEQADKRATSLAAGLVALGVEPQQRVGIASSTRYEWVLADLAIMLAGAATTTVYPTTVADEVSYILADSGCRVVFAEDASQVAKVRERREELPELLKVVTFDPVDEAGDDLLTLAELETLGEKLLAERPRAVEDRVAVTTGDSLATLIYTSGTTGRPKGVRLLHRSWTYEGASIDALDILHEDDLQFLWLPLAHSFGKVLLTAQLAVGFPTAVDGRVDRIIENLGEVRPTFMGAAPRIFEKAHARIMTMTAKEGGLKLRIFSSAFAVGRRVKALELEGKPVPLPLRAAYAVADRLVFSKIRARFGGRVRFFISGAAALNRDVAEWFHVAGILVLEGYGLTETSAGSAVNLPDNYRFGTVGPLFPGTEVAIGEDGEVLLRGPGVMEGYHNDPAATAESLVDGWFHTGDIGEVDGGHLRITDRKKDLFKTSGGKYIAPTMLESQLKALCPYVSQVVVHGNERKYVVAVVTLDEEAITGWAQDNGLGDASYAEIARSPQVDEMIGGHVRQLNERLNRWETIKKWVVLDHDLSVESGELTPSMKVKRKVVEQNYARELEELYT
jgi:long-chain acyl-CoA synthetase